MGSRAIYLCLLLTTLRLLFFYSGTASPVRQMAQGTSPQLSLERHLTLVDQQFIQLAAGRNIQLHFTGFDPSDFDQGLLMSQFYFRANYALFPHRAFVGQSNRIFNLATDLASADVIPDRNWLSQHNIQSVLTLAPTPQGVEIQSNPAH